jgi:small subunit ribosomal protein S6e
MRPTIDGEERRKVLVEQGPGVDGNEDGERRRKTVRGNVVSDEIEQLNTKVVESGDREIKEILAEDEEEE